MRLKMPLLMSGVRGRPRQTQGVPNKEACECIFVVAARIAQRATWVFDKSLKPLLGFPIKGHLFNGDQLSAQQLGV